MMLSASVWLLAFVTALVVAGLVMRAGILDHPNARSSHVRPTPRGGGLGIVVGFLFSLALIPLPAPSDQAALGGLALCAMLTAILGFSDDLVGLSGRLKFAVLAAISLALAGMAGPVTDLGFALPWLVGWLGSALFVFTLANAVNFMDGSDGLLASTLVPAALALGVLADGPIAVAALSLAAATAGFAVWNAPLLAVRGRVFSGDVGALGGAVIFAGLSLAWASTDRDGSVWLVPVLVLPLLGDVLLTMAARVRAGRSPFAAHRAHAYQLLISIGLSHRQVALIWGAMSLACGVLAIVASAFSSHVQLACLVVAVMLFTLGHRRCRKLASSRGLDIHQ